MTKIIKPHILIAFLCFATNIFPQIRSADLTIENQEAIGVDFFFDIYLTRTGTNDIYLSTADFVLTFNSSAFTNPVVTREVSTFWNLTSTNSIQVGSTYRSSTSTAPISGNEIIINLNLVSFGDQQDFDDIIAKIDNQVSTHRVGRYKVSGINDISEFMNFQWKTSGGGSQTSVSSYNNVDPWPSNPITINAINPPNAVLPVELNAFIAKTNGPSIELKWQTKTEINNFGFEIERKSSNLNKNINIWEKISFVEGNGNSNSTKNYSYIDKNPSGSSKFAYRLKQIDNDGKFEYSDEVEVELIPDKFELFQNYPNPFNPVTNIKFSLPNNSKVKLDVFNIIGEHITTLIDKEMESGFYNIPFNAANLSSGTYIYRIQTEGITQTKKMLLVK